MTAENSCCELMNHLIRDVQERNYELFLTILQDRYGVKEFKISQITPSIAMQIYNSIFIKFRKNFTPKTELNWWENELRIFIWVLLCYMELRHLQIEELGQKDWEFFSRLFPNKQNILFEYQALSLQKEGSNNKKWTHEEDEMFAQLVQNRDQKYKWSELAKQLYIMSERQFYRTPKQCRERWLNHLDPSKSKQEWELKEDYILIMHVRNKGKKWAQISKLLKNRRNQHSIKNRFKSLVTKQEKLHTQTLDEAILVDNIYKKYENHFAKLKLANPLIGLSGQSRQQIQNNEDKIPTNSTIPSNLYRNAFQIFPSSHVNAPLRNQSGFNNDAFNLLEFMPTHNTDNIISFPSNISLNAERQERQKQIRADIFMSSDPFDFLRRFFKSKDSEFFQ